MIFIHEQQKQFLRTKDPDYWNAFPYQEANLIFRSLNLLSRKELNKVDEVYFIIDSKSDVKVYEKCFSKYVADVNAYTFDKKVVVELKHKFPDYDELEDTSKKKYIESLINSLKIYSLNSAKELNNYASDLLENEQEVILFLPFCKSGSLNLLEILNLKRVKLFSDKKSLGGISNKVHLFVDPVKYLQIRQKIIDIKPSIEQQEKELYNFFNKEYLEYFGHELLSKVNEHKLKNSKLFLHGEDKFIADRIIDKIMLNIDLYKYYLPKDLTAIENNNTSLVVYNFDSLKHNEDYKYIYEKINGITELKIILQAFRNINIKYFSHFENLRVPNYNEWEEQITNIFLSFLIESNIYIGTKRQLGSFAGNLLKSFFPAPIALDKLYDAARNFREISYEDLKGNIGFWYYLDTILTAQPNGAEMCLVPRQKISIEFLGKYWRVNGLGKSFTIDKIGMLYLCIIIINSNKGFPAIDSLTIRKISMEYLGKQYQDNDSRTKYEMMDSARKTISSAMTELRKIEGLREFINEYFSFSITNNSFNHMNKIEVEVENSELESIVIKK